MNKFSFVTNATMADGIRLKYFLQGVISAFQDTLEEIIVVLDTKPEEGRIKTLHAGRLEQFVSIDEVKLLYTTPLIKFIDLDYSKLDSISLKWFGRRGVNRCQNGTPIFAFLYGIEQCKNSNIIRSDCDILFYNNGFVNELTFLCDRYDIIQLPFMNDEPVSFSTRVFFINRSKCDAILPVVPHQLDLFRRLYRYFLGRTSYLALEQILELEILRRDIACHRMDTTMGNTMHVPTREHFNSIQEVVEMFLMGNIPEGQFKIKHDYVQELWEGRSKHIVA